MPSGDASSDFAALAALLRGRVVLPGSAEYDELRTGVWNKKLEAKPSAIVLVATTKDVQETVKFVANNKKEFTGV